MRLQEARRVLSSLRQTQARLRCFASFAVLASRGVRHPQRPMNIEYQGAVAHLLT